MLKETLEKNQEIKNDTYYLTIVDHNNDIKPCSKYTMGKLATMHEWEIRQVYRLMIERYSKMIGKISDFGVEITPKFIKILENRLKEISIKNNGLL